MHFIKGTNFGKLRNKFALFLLWAIPPEQRTDLQINLNEKFKKWSGLSVKRSHSLLIHSDQQVIRLSNTCVLLAIDKLHWMQTWRYEGCNTDAKLCKLLYVYFNKHLLL